ncbi:MAG: porin [Aestuariivita sp.]|nr:porin [Aestuariivita sp.]
MAAAEVTIDGLGRFGVHYNESANDGEETNLESRFRLNFSATTQSDAGIEFGGKIRIEHNDGDNADKVEVTHATNGDNVISKTRTGAQTGAAQMHAKLGAATVLVGNVGDAVDSMPGLYLPTSSVGTGLNYMDPGLVTIHDIGGFGDGPGVVNGVALKFGMGDLNLQVNASDDHSDRVLSGYVSYKIGDWQIALAGLDNSDADQNIVVGTVTGDLGFASVGAAFGQNENVDSQNGVSSNIDADKFRLFGHIPVGMATELVVWGADEDKNGSKDGSSFGIDIEHHLGGGVTAVAGYSDSARNDDKGAQASAGVLFKF